MVLLRTVLPSHHVVWMRLAPPLWRIGAKARQQKCLRVRLENLGTRVVGGAPVRHLAGRGPRHAHRKADKVYTGAGSHFYLRLKRPRWSSEVNERATGPIKSHGQLACRLGLHPERNAVMLASDKPQLRQAVDMKIGPVTIGWLAQVDVKTRGVPVTNCRFHFDRAHGVGHTGRPEGPIAFEGLRSVLEVGNRHHFAHRQFRDPDVVEENVSWRLAKPKVQRAGISGILLGNEIEFDFASCGLDFDGCGARSAKKHARADWLAIHHQPWRT